MRNEGYNLRFVPDNLKRQEMCGEAIKDGP